MFLNQATQSIHLYSLLSASVYIYLPTYHLSSVIYLPAQELYEAWNHT